MLTQLYIKNYALIENLEVDFEPGFSVITGETGAGKSIILGAIALLLGQRADAKQIFPNKNKCIIEAHFVVKNHPELHKICTQKELEYDNENLILRREIGSNGKSRAFVNDSPTTLSNLKEIGEYLIDIHSQHKNLLLGNHLFQLNVLDAIAQNAEVREEYQHTFYRYQHTKKQLLFLQQQNTEAKKEQDYITYQLNLLNDASLKADEQEELEETLLKLKHAEEIKRAFYNAQQVLGEQPHNAVELLREAYNQLNNITSLMPQAQQLGQQIFSAYIEMKELIPEMEQAAESIELSPQKLSQIEERLDVIYSLQQKHHVNSIAQLLEIKHELEEKLESIENLDADIKNTQQQLTEIEDALYKQAKNLSDRRKKGVDILVKSLTQSLKELGMPNVKIECQITDKEQPDASGTDNLQLLFSANKNSSLQPISDVASGGEIARVMLCIKALMAQTGNMPTIIFDEIDTGVSGEVADKMGQIMQQFGNQKQVISITHLPQIASKGKNHYFVYKTHLEHATITNIKQLSAEERIHEIAQMLSGSVVTEEAILNAKTMLQQ